MFWSLATAVRLIVITSFPSAKPPVQLPLPKKPAVPVMTNFVRATLALKNEAASAMPVSTEKAPYSASRSELVSNPMPSSSATQKRSKLVKTAFTQHEAPQVQENEETKYFPKSSRMNSLQVIPESQIQLPQRPSSILKPSKIVITAFTHDQSMQQIQEANAADTAKNAYLELPSVPHSRKTSESYMLPNVGSGSPKDPNSSETMPLSPKKSKLVVSSFTHQSSLVQEQPILFNDISQMFPQQQQQQPISMEGEQPMMSTFTKLGAPMHRGEPIVSALSELATPKLNQEDSNVSPLAKTIIKRK